MIQKGVQASTVKIYSIAEIRRDENRRKGEKLLE